MARILLVEDDEAVRAFVARALAMDGHAVVTASDGGEGLERVAAEGADLDLVLTDIKMPVMDGIALAMATARDWPALKIMLMTGYADQRERASHLEALVEDVLTKPFTLAEVRTRVAAILARPKRAA